MATGIILGVTYPVLSKGLHIVHAKPHSTHTNLMQSMLKMGCDEAKMGSASSLFLKLASIHVVQNSMAANLLHGNLQTEKVGNLWGNTPLFDSTFCLPQHDMVKVERIQKEKQARTNKRVMHIADSKQTLPNTSTEKIEHIKTVKHCISLVVNTAYVASTCVDVDTMESAGSEYLLVTLSTISSNWLLHTL